MGGLEVLTSCRGGEEHLAAATADLGIDQHGPVGAIGQRGQDRQWHCPRDPPQQGRSRRAGLLPGLVAGEVAVGQDEHPGGEPADQRRGEGLFAGGHRA